MDKTKQTLVIALVAVLVVLAGGWFLLVSPQRANVASLNEQTTTQEQTNASLQTKITALKAELVQLPEAKAQLEAVARRLPPDLAEVSLIQTLTKAADRRQRRPADHHAWRARCCRLRRPPRRSPRPPRPPAASSGTAAAAAPAAAPAASAGNLYAVPDRPDRRRRLLRPRDVRPQPRGHAAGASGEQPHLHQDRGRVAAPGRRGCARRPPWRRATGTTTAKTTAQVDRQGHRPRSRASTRARPSRYPGSAAAAQAAQETCRPFVADQNTLTVTIAARSSRSTRHTPAAGRSADRRPDVSTDEVGEFRQ